MLDFIYYPVSWILWVWHQVFGAVFGPSSGAAWGLAVVFLVFTLRLILYWPFVKQVRTTRQMQELQPEIKALQKKYANDRQKMALEMQKLQREHGFNPLMGCLPVLAQAPVFIGLFHVLRSFNRTGTGFGQLGMTPEENANTPNYVFSVDEVQSFLSARIFGAPISSFITEKPDQLQAYAEWGGVPTTLNIAAVAIPLMVVASIATHFNSRASVARQSAAAAANPQAAIMNKLALWVFPIGVLVGGPFLPIAILIYWVSNNIWTYGQQHLVFTRIEKEEEAKKVVAVEKRAANAPKPGAKPVYPKKGATPVDNELADSSDTETISDSEPTQAAPAKRPPSKPSGQRRSGQKRPGNRGRANQKKRR
ncbi:MAG TPA: membrane protein insertase YidC [Aldersonia sp.]